MLFVWYSRTRLKIKEIDTKRTASFFSFIHDQGWVVIQRNQILLDELCKSFTE